MTTMTATAAVWEQEELAECVRCGEAMTVRPVVHGIALGHGAYLCGVCFFYIYDGSKAQALAALGLELGPSGDDDGDDDGPDGGPAAPAARPRPGVLTDIAAGRGPAGYELSVEEEQELDEFEALVLATAPDPEPCLACSRPASPAVETDAGVWCFACADAGAGGPALQRRLRLGRTFCRMVAARLGQTVVEASVTAVPC